MFAAQRFLFGVIGLVIFGIMASGMFAGHTASFQHLYMGFSTIMFIIGFFVKKLLKLAIKVMILGTLLYFGLNALTSFL
jgi:hypothetical protein